jgi:hypothetical protein
LKSPWSLLRNDASVARVRREEEAARRCIGAALDGVVVVWHDDQSQAGMYDLEIRRAGDRVAAVEVTQVLDSEPAVAWDMLNSTGRWIAPVLDGGWAVRLRPEVRVKPLRVELPKFLAALEQAGVRSVGVGSWAPGPLQQRAEELGIIHASQSGTEFPGSIYPMPAQTFDKTTGYAADTGDALAEWVGDWLRQPIRSDNLAKLRRSGAAECHMFIILPPMADAEFGVTELFVRGDAPLPTVPPDLPPEVTHVWVAGAWGYPGMRWSPEAGWERFATRIE